MKNRLLNISNGPAIYKVVSGFLWWQKNNSVLGEPRVQVGADDPRTILRLFKSNPARMPHARRL